MDKILIINIYDQVLKNRIQLFQIFQEIYGM